MRFDQKLLLSIFLLAFLAAGCSGGGGKTTPTPEGDEASRPAPVVNATGVIIPEKWSDLSLQNPGVIEEILVEKGEPVRAGQVLLRIQGREGFEAAVAAAELDYLSAQKAIDDLNSSHNEVRAAAQLRLANAVKALDKAQEKREGKDYQRAHQSYLDTARADYILALDEFEKAEDMWAYYEDRSENDVTRAGVLSLFAAARLKKDKALWNLNYLESLPDDMEVAQAEGELVVARAELEAAQKEWEKVKNGPDAVEMQLANARLLNTEKQLGAARTALENAELKAPIDGIVNTITIRAGEYVVPGQVVLTLADLQNLIVETTDLNEIDVARVNVGDLVEITFDALPDMVVAGRVTNIGSKSAEGSGVTYPVTVVMDEIPEGLRWGMTAFVDIMIK
jgi:multidrug resistance efflux pump